MQSVFERIEAYRERLASKLPAVAKCTRSQQVISTIEMHTAGEPLRVILSGYPDPEGDTVLERRAFIRDIFAPLISVPGAVLHPIAQGSSKQLSSFKLRGVIVGGGGAIAMINDQLVRTGEWIGAPRLKTGPGGKSPQSNPPGTPKPEVVDDLRSSLFERGAPDLKCVSAFSFSVSWSRCRSWQPPRMIVAPGSAPRLQLPPRGDSCGSWRVASSTRGNITAGSRRSPIGD